MSPFFSHPRFVVFRFLCLFLLLALCLPISDSLPVAAEEVRVAVASNFLSTFQSLAREFEKHTGHTVVISPGSSGKLYAQITHGAPFDIFFSADDQRPRLLEEEGLAVKGTRFPYAVGRLTLWSLAPDMLKDNGPDVLRQAAFSHLAIANPKTAPYGKAAEQVLQALGLWDTVQPKLVQGENIGQTLQFVASQNADLGFVALSQILDSKMEGKGSRWDAPSHLHVENRQGDRQPALSVNNIIQEAVLRIVVVASIAAKALLLE